MEHFVPVALDTYFRGNSQEVEFCKKVGAGGNHLVAVTAGGKILGAHSKQHLFMREKELRPILAEFSALPREERQVDIGDPKLATPSNRPVPDPPVGGLVVRGYCTYLKFSQDKYPVRAKNFYYKQNPDRWPAETQSDMLWLTEQEWKSLLPADIEIGKAVDVAEEVQRRFFSTIGIDYMEGSVNALVPRKTKMSITVSGIEGTIVSLQLVGHGEMGKAFSETEKADPKSRGCRLEVVGKLSYDTDEEAFTQFNLVGIGKAWGNKMEYTRREIGIEDYPWMYGVACELVSGNSAMDCIPPYNLLHYGGRIPYF
jgi:hypothetical protein